jgi:hypothetical protein
VEYSEQRNPSALHALTVSLSQGHSRGSPPESTIDFTFNFEAWLRRDKTTSRVNCSGLSEEALLEQCTHESGQAFVNSILISSRSPCLGYSYILIIVIDI